MALSLQIGYPLVPKSITNPNVSRKDALDVDYPMAFLTFIKIINVSFEPESLQNYYNDYIKVWNSKSISKTTDDQSTITERYRDFIKELTLNYTTLEEKQFLSKIDFNDKYDLDVALGFYSRKLKELTAFYNNKRNDIKFSLIRNKLKGTNFGAERTIEELVLSYLKTLDDGKILYDYDEIKKNIDIEIEEMYDTYSLYFNQTPNDRIYDNKDLDYGLNIFLRTDADLLSSVFYNISSELQQIKELDQLFENKRLLTEKYMSTDFYYLSTGATTSDILSGKLFSNVNSSSNIPDRYYPTTASTEQTNYLQTSRERGFFRPSNVTIALVDGINHSFVIDQDNLEPNSLYFFPDPNIAGQNGDVLTFIVDDSYLKKNYSSGNANNQPSTDQYDTKYYGYVSKIEPNVQKGLDSIFDIGYIKDFKRDISGNLYGLFVSDGTFEQTISLTTSPSITSVLFNGYQLYDDLYGQGLTFDYLNTTYSCSACTETIISGLSTYTGGFTNFTPDLVLSFGSIANNKELAAPLDDNLITHYNIVEGAFFVGVDDPVSSDLSAFETSLSSFYYEELIECGLLSANPIQRALWEPNSPLLSSLSASLLESFREPAMNIVDGGWFTIPFPDYVLSPTSYYYDNTVLVPSQISPIDIPALSGKLMVKNVITRQVLPVLDAMPYLNTKFLSATVIQLEDKVNRFETTYDVLIMETDNWMTINKVKNENGVFVDPKTLCYSLQHSISGFDTISNRLKTKNYIYFSKFSALSSTTTNNFVLYPEIYRFDMLEMTSEMIYPIGNIDTTFFNVSGGDIRYISGDAPIIGYDSQSNNFILSIVLRDQNDMVIIHDYSFYLNPNVIFSSHTKTKPSSNDISNIFGTETLNYFLSSNSIITYNEELIL